MPPDWSNIPSGSIARTEAIPGQRYSFRDDSPRRKPSRRGVDLDKPEGSTGSNSRCDRTLFMQYSPDRDPRRMDLPKYPTYWPGSNSPPLLRIHRRLRSIAEPLLKGRYPRTRAGSRKEAIPGRTSVLRTGKSRDVLQQGKIPSTEVSACMEAIPLRRLLPKRVNPTHGETLRTGGLSLR
jgi:hypothetical protein